MTWQERFDRLLKGMAHGEPHKAEKRAAKPNKAAEAQEIDDEEARQRDA